MHSTQFRFVKLLLPALCALVFCGAVRAQQIPVPNALFSSPSTTFAYPVVMDWESLPPNDFTDPNNPIVYAGVFYNDPAEQTNGLGDYLYNCVGPQAAFLVSAPTAQLFQDYASVDGFGESNTFAATYTVGKSYQLTAQVTGGSVEPLTQGTILQMALYYRDASNNMVTFASTNIVYDTNVFPSTNFLTFELDSPKVTAGASNAGQYIGIAFNSLATDQNYGGTWDINDVQLYATPLILNPFLTNGQFAATVRATPNTGVEILSTSDLTIPVDQWQTAGFVYATSGSNQFIYSNPSNSLFFTAQPGPVIVAVRHP